VGDTLVLTEVLGVGGRGRWEELGCEETKVGIWNGRWPYLAMFISGYMVVGHPGIDVYVVARSQRCLGADLGELGALGYASLWY
jgi:hypothetical protein